MTKLTTREIKRLLAARGTPQPPPGLADRIKAEIPDVLQLGGVGPQPEGVRGMPPRVPALRPLWLLAASLLIVIGAGFVAVRFFAPTSDLAREIALGGVVRIEDVVVTVPERSTVERQKAGKGIAESVDLDRRVPAPARPGTHTQVASSRPAAPAGGPAPVGALAVTVRDGKEPIPGVTITAARVDAAAATPRTAESGEDGQAEIAPLPPGEYTVRAEREGFEAREAKVRVAAGAEDRVNVAMKPEAAAAAAPAAGKRAAADRGAAGLPAPETAKGSILVTVRASDGSPVPGATVLLSFADRPDVGCGFRSAGSAGVATFCCVAPGAYRICAQSPGFLAASEERVAVPAGRQVTVELRIERQPADGTARPWTCPTPRPAGTP